MNTTETATEDETECPDCGVEYIDRGKYIGRLCQCNATQEDIDDMERENMEEGRAFWGDL